MKLLSHLLPSSVRALPTGSGFTVAVAVCLVGLEVVGRQAASDVHDGLAALILVSLGAAVALRHKREPLPWVTRAAGWATRLLGKAPWARYDHGVDLRGTPPLPRGTPPVVGWLVLALVGLGVVSGLAWWAFPAGWREVGVHTSYVLYLGCLLALWGVLLACIFVGVFVPVQVLDRWLKRWLGDTDRRGAELAAVVGYAVLVSAIAFAVPPAAVLVLCLVVAAGAAVAYLPRGADTAAVLWRAGAGKPVYAVPLHRVLAVITLLATLLVFDVLLTACGGRLTGTPAAADGMPVTALLGAMAAWLVPALMLVAAGRVWTAWQHDPARRDRPTGHVGGGDALGRRRAATALGRWGWRVRPLGHKAAGDVGVELVTPDRSEATEFDPRWPLKVSVADLETGGVKDRLERRDEIQLRRQFFRGLAKLFRRAALFRGPGGGGFWVAPQWWFIEGMGREDAEGGPDEGAAPRLVGPPYHRVFSARARQHLHQVLRATQVDMIYVEDGIGHRKVEKVVRLLLELFDVHGGQRRAEELHFRGLPKVRVMIHDYEPGNPFESDLYPEPKFDELSRVRVLHVFRDRGGEEEEVEPPFDWSSSPAPAGAMG